MSAKPKLLSTRNYGVFEMHEFNRPLHDDPVLLESMRRFGFLQSSPIHCVTNGHGKLKVLRGNNRLSCAKRLGLPVTYVIEDTKADIFALEASPRAAWNGPDYCYARAQSGDVHCLKVLEFQKQHGLTLGSAASLLGGESAGSGNMIKAIKAGTFRVADDLSHAYAVVGITDYCRAIGLAFATSSAFVAAVSMALRVPDVDIQTLKQRIKRNGLSIQRCARKEDYLDELERLYNYAAKGPRVPLAFMARELSRERHENFGHRVAQE